MLNKQLEKFGLTIDDVKDDDRWYDKYKVTKEEHMEWRNFCINIMRKELRWSKREAEKEFVWMNLMWGLSEKKV